MSRFLILCEWLCWHTVAMLLLFLEWEKDDQYNGSPPRPAPRGPRTPPGPPPPDDDDEEQVQVTGQNCISILCRLHYNAFYLPLLDPD